MKLSRRDELRPLEGGHVVKLACDEPVHFTAGPRASEAVERAGIVTARYMIMQAVSDVSAYYAVTPPPSCTGLPALQQPSR